jgi:ComEC/Rec2-related protein
VLFLFGTFAAANDWDVSFLLWFSFASAIAAIEFFHDDPSVLGGLLLACIALPFALLYYHLRTAQVGDPTFGGMSSSFSVSSGSSLISLDLSPTVGFPYEEASLLDAIFSGSLRGLPSAMQSAMTDAGTAYIVGMYGFKIHLLADTVKNIAARFVSPRIAMTVMIFVVGAFIVYAGASRAAMRAGTMIIVTSFAEMAGRRISAWRALLFVAAVIVAIDPSSWRSSGFLLSLASIGGIYVFAGPLRAILGNSDILSWKTHAAMACAVNVAILPLVAVLYGSFPLISFVSNVLIALPFAAIMMLGVLLAATQTMVPYAAFAIVPTLALLLRFQIFISRIFSIMPLAISGASFSPFVIFLYYAALVGSGYAINRRVHGKGSRRAGKLSHFSRNPLSFFHA